MSSDEICHQPLTSSRDAVDRFPKEYYDRFMPDVQREVAAAGQDPSGALQPPDQLKRPKVTLNTGMSPNQPTVPGKYSPWRSGSFLLLPFFPHSLRDVTVSWGYKTAARKKVIHYVVEVQIEPDRAYTVIFRGAGTSAIVEAEIYLQLPRGSGQCQWHRPLLPRHSHHHSRWRASSPPPPTLRLIPPQI